MKPDDLVFIKDTLKDLEQASANILEAVELAEKVGPDNPALAKGRWRQVMGYLDQTHDNIIEVKFRVWREIQNL